ncbi:MAG: TonB-dependent receptor [Candidatus Brocadia sp.]|uniref:TonB-dependent receptor n=1 Tax=Candidatus Brocadia fulgida TaxID=380242 RepID=A0A0M2UVG1_9BACT|nr:MAG: TonB-dependent receptor [Candidatus Brocadia fulgida]UJS20724.1 MAG: TonB-dependent receptor [Candidatus Brocadia sp.]
MLSIFITKNSFPLSDALGKFRLTLITLFIPFCFLPCLCLAEAEQEHILESTPISDEVILFQEIPSVYSASKYEQKVTEAPSSVSIITADEIKKYGYRNFSEILRSIRGFHITYDRNYHYVGVRGFGLSGDYNTRILLLIDGHRINDAIYDQAPIGTDFPLDIDLIERIEIIRGPGSSLYGTNAFFGVVNVITRKGRGFRGAEASAEAGTFETYKTRMSYGEKFSNGLEMVISGSYYESEGDDRLFFQEFDQPANNHGIAEDRDRDQFENIFAEILYRDFTLQLNYHDREKDVPTAPFGTLFNEQFFTADERGWADLKYERIFGDQFSFLSRVSYNFYDYNDDYFTSPPTGKLKTSDVIDSQWLQGEVQITKTFFERHKCTFGIDSRYNMQQDQRTFNHIQEGTVPGIKREILDDKRESEYFAGYLQDEFTLTDFLTLQAGVRFDYFETFGGTANPRAALIYTPFEKTAFKFVYGRAFREPNAYELYYSDDTSQKSSPDLDPETIDTYEIIYEQYFAKYFRGTIVGFYNSIDDFISLTTDPHDGLLVFDNVDGVHARGFEFELEGKSELGFEGRASYSIQEAEGGDSGGILVNSPKHLAKFNMIIPMFKRKLFLSGEEQYTGKRRTIMGSSAGDYFITNVTLYSRNIFKTLEVSGGVFNLFDMEYEDPGGEEHAQDVIEQDGRVFRIKITYAF